MSESIKVRLKVDLTRYGAGLVPGIEGYTIGTFGSYSRTSDRFVGVCFPNIAKLDVLWDSLEIIDEAYLAKIEELKKKKLEALKTARNVVKHVGPRGGFRGLSYEIIEGGVHQHISNGFKDEVEELMKVFKQYGIDIQETVDP